MDISAQKESGQFLFFICSFNTFNKFIFQ